MKSRDLHARETANPHVIGHIVEGGGTNKIKGVAYQRPQIPTRVRPQRGIGAQTNLTSSCQRGKVEMVFS